ncbi:MAG: sigma 54-interacting transcriptional regulator [Planctomycetota bacterium]|nr:sigma 54-interacting transcriptional regulator [Planctomycetota bacterium]MDA0921514.1 sigma 54-interacting transcriptional regulator [Planctomycetota bacterium]MDA1160204.1 sigma 54-interacting transcriptional regulator [Planctomycetota bacterium]
MSADQPGTLGDLKASGYLPTSVKDEMRRNLIRKLKSHETLFPEIIGYDETVIPQITNAILSRHDLLFLGLRGQGKTRMLRMLTAFLDDSIPIVAGSEINDDPLSPLSRFARDRVAVEGDSCPIEWVGRSDRYHEKLATPDVTIADLIGEVDLIKHAEGRHLSSEDVMHFGLIPRSHRGIFCMNELPDLSPKIQVGLFNVLEERDIQIRGFTVRLPLDLCLVFSANPEDYTNRGRIVTPLKDRIGSVISTHYPATRELGVTITKENAWTDRDTEVSVFVPTFIRSILEETSRLARTSPHVNQASGVSVRMSIANLENAVSNAERRGLLHAESHVVVGISDLAHIAPSARGKMELAMSDEPGEEDRLVSRLLAEATRIVFDELFKPKQFRSLVEHFESSESVVIGDGISCSNLRKTITSLPVIGEQLTDLASALEPDFPQEKYRSAFEVSVAGFVLDALHHHNRLNRRTTEHGQAYGL